MKDFICQKDFVRRKNYHYYQGWQSESESGIRNPESACFFINFKNPESGNFGADSGFLCKNPESGIRDISVQIIKLLLQILPTHF